MTDRTEFQIGPLVLQMFGPELIFEDTAGKSTVRAEYRYCWVHAESGRPIPLPKRRAPGAPPGVEP